MNTHSFFGFPHHQGFTRAELCALGVGLSVLAATQLPLAGTTRTQAQAGSCLDNQRRLIVAWQIYATDGNGWFPPNADDGNTSPGMNWVGGQGGRGGGSEFNPDLVTNPRTSMLAEALKFDAAVFRCPADGRSGIYQGAKPELQGQRVAAARSVSMNHAVGTNPYRDGAKVPTDGPWLDNSHSHTYGQRWLTYGQEAHLITPGPARTMVITEEDPNSLNDGTLAFGMVTPEWIDFPATFHDQAANLSFADGHAELHRWTDRRTTVGATVARRPVPGSPDYTWLRDRISAAIPR